MKSRVLYVEDDAELRTLGIKIIERRGYEVIAAYDGKIALERFRQAKHVGKTIDLVITDVNMPNISGYDLLELLRGSDGYKGKIAILDCGRLPESDKSRLKLIYTGRSVLNALKAYEKTRGERQ